MVKNIYCMELQIDSKLTIVNLVICVQTQPKPDAAHLSSTEFVSLWAWHTWLLLASLDNRHMQRNKSAQPMWPAWNGISFQIFLSDYGRWIHTLMWSLMCTNRHNIQQKTSQASQCANVTVEMCDTPDQWCYIWPSHGSWSLWMGTCGHTVLVVQLVKSWELRGQAMETCMLLVSKLAGGWHIVRTTKA